MEKLVLDRVGRILRALFSARKWQRFWSREWVLKFISLVLATLLWYFVGGEDIVDKNVMVPIEIINLPRDLVISNQFKKEIEVTVSGPRSAIEEMTSKAATRQINLSSATPGTNVIENEPASITVPRGVTVLRIQPTSIILSLDKLIQKQFPVTPVTTGQVAEGFKLQNLVMNPDVITITGPKTILSQADELLTENIDINGLKESKSFQVPLDLEPNFVDLIGETSVTAEVTVKPEMVERKVSKVPVVAIVQGETREVAPKTVDVLIRVPVLLLRQTKDVRALFSVSAAESDNDGEYLKVSLVPKESNILPIELVSIIPSAVKLVSHVESAEETDMPQSDVEQMLPKNEEEKRPDAPQTETSKVKPVDEEDEEAIVKKETSGEDASGVQILPVKTKRHVQPQ